MKLEMKDLLMNEAGRTRTENNAVAEATTGNEVLNLFALGGAVRQRPVNEVINLIDAAWKDDPNLALRTIFYLGDIRGGQGERRFFLTALKYLADKVPNIAMNIINLIPEYSRWDTLFVFMDTPLEGSILELMKNQFIEDLKSDKPSLLAKWLPSPGTKSQKKLANRVARAFNMEIGQYRRLRAGLNRRINTVEVKMSAKQWEDIDYEKVPAKAFMNYQKAFERHGYEKMQKFVEKVQSGDTAIKSKTLYPHEVVYKSLRAQDNELITLQSAWENLPNYVKDDRRGIAVIDTSSSMEWGSSGRNTPSIIARSLGMYLSERLSGPYKDHYITFSDQPIMAKFHGSNLAEKYRNMEAIVSNTNIEAVYDLILDVALRNNLTQDDLPTHLYIFSDMEFDEATSSSWDYTFNDVNLTLMEKFKNKYNYHGFEMPITIFWNLDSRNNQYPVTQHDSGVALVSGFSPVTFKYIMEGIILTPFQTMLKVLEAPRYSILSKAFE